MSELTWSSGDHRTSREPVAYVGKNVVVGNPLAMSGIQSYRNLGPLLLGIHPNYSRTCSLSLSLSLSSSIPCVMRMSRSDHHGSADQLKNPTQIKVCARKSHPDRKKEKNKQLTAPNTAMINDYLRPKTGPHKVFFTLASCSHVRCPMCRRNHCSLLPLHFFPPPPLCPLPNGRILAWGRCDMYILVALVIVERSGNAVYADTAFCASFACRAARSA